MPKASSQVSRTQNDEGYMLVACIVMCFLMLLALSVAAPAIAKQLQHDKELESQRRAEQYVRALRVYYRKNHNYPTSIDQLLNSNNQRFLRQKYIDPLTGKDDWRLIHFGENKTTVKGFFGKDLPGLAAGAGLGGSTGNAGSAGNSGSTSAFANNSSTAPGSTGSNLSGSTASSGFSLGSSGVAGAGTGSGAGSTSGSLSGSTTSAGSGTQSSSGLSSGTVGPIIGIGSARSGQAMLAVNGEDQYENWEFLYDPRIEQLYAQGQLNSGISSSSSATSPSTSGSGTPFGGPVNGTSPAPPAAPVSPQPPQ